MSEIVLSNRSKRRVRFSPHGEFYSLLKLAKGHLPVGLPAPVWRDAVHLRWGAIALLIPMLAVSVGLLCGFLIAPAATMNAPFGFKLLPGLVSGGFLWGSAFIRRRIKASTMSFVRASNFQICAHCGYSLKDLPESHQCPECGLRYQLPVLTNEWIAWESGS